MPCTKFTLMFAVRGCTQSHYLLKLKSNIHKMPQPSITKFFKIKPQENQTKTQDTKTHDTEAQDPKTPIKGGSTATSTDTKDSVKRPMEGENDKTLNKRMALSPPTKLELNPIFAAISSPGQLKTCPSPLGDINVLIRKKISNGAFALHENIGKSWFRALLNEFDKPYFKNLSKFVQQERSTKTVFPPENKVFTWTHHYDIKDTKVVILGQDPYHGPGQAHGLSFSVQKGVKPPPSLVNIFKEVSEDIPEFIPPSCGDLTGWAKQGVLLLNTCLSVNQGQANSHQGKGWESFTDAVISWISKNIKHKVVFILWGTPARKKSSLIDKRHIVLTSVHPSPLSAYNGFFGCKHFSKTNNFLKQQGLPEIDWKAL